MFVKKILKLAASGATSNSDSKKKLPGLGSNSNITSQKDALTLPVNFADEVFNLELETERPDVDINVVNRLLELYAIAIEYYESIKSEKYVIFKNKTRSLLLKQNVSLAMDKAQEELKTEPNEEKESDFRKDKQQYVLTEEDDDLKQRQKELELNVLYIQQQDTKDSVLSLINSHSQDIRQTKKIIQQDTELQHRLIQQRLQKRKNKIHGSNDTEENEQKDKQQQLLPSSYSGSQPLKRQSSAEQIGRQQNLLDMDIYEVSTPMKTEPNAQSQSSSQNDELFSNYYKTPLSYEQKILRYQQQQQYNQANRNASSSGKNNANDLVFVDDTAQCYNNNSIWNNQPVQEPVSAFRAEGQENNNNNDNSSAKKKKKQDKGNPSTVAAGTRGTQQLSDFAITKMNADFREYKRQVNKLVLDEESVDKIEDSRESKFYFEKMRYLEQTRLFILALSQAFAMLANELEFNEQVEFYHLDTLLYLTIGSSIIIILMTYCSYFAWKQFLIATKEFGPNATLINTGLWQPMFSEMILLCICPMPWFRYYKISFFVEFYQVEVFHYLNDILLLAMMLRFILIVKIILIHTSWYNDRTNRVANLYATKMKLLLIAKINMRSNPMKVFWFCYVLTLFLLSYSIRICERPLSRLDSDVGAFHFSYYPTALWMLIISIPSVGYGDKYPVTPHGRILAAVSFICGTFLFSILCNSLATVLNINSQEQKAQLVMTKLHTRKRILLIATKMFSFVAKITRRNRKNLPKDPILHENLRDEAKSFKAINRYLRSLQDESNLMEQITKQFGYMKDELQDVGQKLVSAQTLQKEIHEQITLQASNMQNILASSKAKKRTSIQIFQVKRFNLQESKEPEEFTLRSSESHKKLSQQKLNSRRSLQKTQTEEDSIEYYTEDMEVSIKQKPYSFGFHKFIVDNGSSNSDQE